MAPGTPDVDAIVRLSVVHAERRTDLVVPGRLPLVEVLPGIARSLGVLDPTLLHGGYRLTRADGTVLDPARGALTQGIDHGEVLTLVRGQLVTGNKNYDDIVEAVIDATSTHHGAWQAEDAARTATAVSLTLIALCALLLLLQGPGSLVAAVIAGSGSIVLLALGATLSRLRQHDSGIAFGLAASAFAALTGFLLAPSALLWGVPLACASAGAIIGGGLAMLVTRRPIELLALPVALGVALGLPSGIVALTGIDPLGPYAITVALAGMLAGALPWLTLSSTRITVVSPQSELEMFDPPPHIDPEKVRARVASGHRLLVSLRIAFALTALVATPLVAATSWMGTLLTAIAGAVLMFQSRQSTARASVVVLLAGGTAIIALSGLMAVLSHPGQAPILLVALLIATGLVTGLTLLSNRVRMRLSTLGDTVEVLLLALLLPLGAITAGLA